MLGGLALQHSFLTLEGPMQLHVKIIMSTQCRTQLLNGGGSMRMRVNIKKERDLTQHDRLQSC